MIKKDFTINPTEEEFQRLAGKRAERLLRSTRARKDFEAVQADLLDLVQPIAGWNRFPISKYSGERIVLDHGTGAIFEGRGVARVVKGARELVVAVLSIGAGVETRIQEYMAGHQSLRGTLLDGFASWAVHVTRLQFVDWLKREVASSEGYRASIPVSPGEASGFPMANQRVIFSLLNEETEEIGVTLKESLLMIPLKSVSLVVGVGPDPLGLESGHDCNYCNLRERCKFRHLRATN